MRLVITLVRYFCLKMASYLYFYYFFFFLIVSPVQEVYS